MRVALLSYRSKPHCGGQGVYVRHLSRELVALGHDVEVFSGQPYPELDPGVRLTKVPSLDLYREPDPFRTPRPPRDPGPRRPARGRDDVDRRLPRAADVQPARGPAAAGPARDFDVVHDNQTLGYGMLAIERAGLPVVTTIHHPITFDRRVDLAAATTLAPAEAAPLVRLPADAGQGRPAARHGAVPVVESSARDVVRDFGVDPARVTGGPDGRRPRLPAADRAAGARADRRDGQRGHPDEGDRDPARGVRQAPHRARRRAADGQPSEAGRPDRADRRPPRDQRARCASCTASATRSSPRWWGRPRSPACRRSTRASRCRPSRRWPARRRWWSAGPGPSPRWSVPTGSAPTWSPPGTSASSRPRWSAARRPRPSCPDGGCGTGARARGVRLAGRRRGHRRGVPSDAIDETTEEDRMLTVDFDRLGLQPGTGSSTWAAGPAGTRSRCSAAAATCGLRPGR